MYRIIFYKDKRKKSDVLEFFQKLQQKSESNKDARIQYNSIIYVVRLLQHNGRDLPEKYVKHLGDGLWELRPGCNRIIYFYAHEDEIVLLHSFRKKTQKTPKKELEKARIRRADYLERKENQKSEEDI